MSYLDVMFLHDQRRQLQQVIKTADATLTPSEMNGNLICNLGQAADMTLTLPPASQGMNAIFAVSTTGYAIHIKAGTSDKLYIGGVATDDADKVSNTVPALGDYVTIFSWLTAAGTYDWIVQSGVGTWIDGGA